MDKASKRRGEEFPIAISKHARRRRYYSSHVSPDSSDSDSDADFTPTSRPFKPHPPTSKPPIPPTPTPTKPPNLTDHLRLWFLQNLSNPYPTPAKKDFLATASGVPRSKVDSDLTNWRRRAGWTDIKDRWAEGDKARMRRLIEGYEEGLEGREEVVEEIERMRGYLERREEERVGDWVHEVGLPQLSFPIERFKADESSSPRWPRRSRTSPPPKKRRSPFPANPTPSQQCPQTRPQPHPYPHYPPKSQTETRHSPSALSPPPLQPHPHHLPTSGHRTTLSRGSYLLMSMENFLIRGRG